MLTVNNELISSLTHYSFEILGFFYLILQFIGLYFAIDAIMRGRTSQGRVAWALSLITFPLLSVPAYMVFGARKFHGYVEARRAGGHSLHKLGKGVQDILAKYQVPQDESGQLEELKNLALMPGLSGNKLKLLIDGRQTFNALLSGINSAEHTIIVQFYIVRHDDIGKKIKEALIQKAKNGVHVYFLYDEIGSYYLDKAFVEDLKAAGVQIYPFATTLGHRARRFQLNFRNHRKIVIIDGQEAFVGGHNIGDEYLGNNPKRGQWRDTHVSIKGPIVKAIQLCFLEDWYWASNEIPNLPWEEVSSSGSMHSLCIPSGPSDPAETCALLFMSLINNAKKRIWITTPYFVPARSVINSLILAVLRGVDVRIMVPRTFDSRLIQYASMSYMEDCWQHGIKFYSYRDGFMHQKVVLIDDDETVVGTANFDNRSFYLNFEISIFTISRKFASEVEEMLLKDFDHCHRLSQEDFSQRKLRERFFSRLASLFAPVL